MWNSKYCFIFFFAFINLPFYQDLSNEDGLNGKSEFCGNINSASENPFNGIPIQIALISPNILDNASIRWASNQNYYLFAS